MLRYRVIPIGALIALGLVLPQSSRADGNAEPSHGVIEFSTRPKSDTGVVVCALFDKSGWLTKPIKPDWAKIKNRRAVCTFTDVQPGTYGISAYHDENRNGKLDTNVVGMPIEDYGASRNARGAFSAPSFEDAKFLYKGGKLRLSAELK